MAEYTTLRIKKETKDKLDLCKGTNNLNYNDIIEKLLEQSGGAIVEDVIEIKREKTAFTLNYWDAEKQIKNDISFADLSSGYVGKTFRANSDRERPAGDWFNSRAEIVASKDDDVILLVTEVSCRNSKIETIKSVVHIELF